MAKQSGAKLLVKSLTTHQVPYIFTVPGASIDPILDILVDEGPKPIVCRHEQNAAFMAQAWGRITGRAGVCLATAGPGATNLITGIATAEAERCPLVAITGQVSRSLLFKRAHQHIDAVHLIEAISKWSVGVDVAKTLPDIVANAFRIAEHPREGATHLSIPMDVLQSEASVLSSAVPPSISTGKTTETGSLDPELMKEGARILNQAQSPVILLGIAASKPHNAEAIRAFVKHLNFPVCATFEAAGAISRPLLPLFLGRLGVFPNQPGDAILKQADVVLTIGFDPVEYDPDIWNQGLSRTILHCDEIPPMVSQSYQPSLELIGDIPHCLSSLQLSLPEKTGELPKGAKKAHQALIDLQQHGATLHGSPVHPLRLIYELRQAIDDTVTVISDVGSHQYWMGQTFYCFKPQYFLTSMGFQSMGVSLPWAIAAALARPGQKVVSISGDGSFLMHSMELETACRLCLPIVHFVWEDGSYNLVAIQQMEKYRRTSATDFGPIDTVRYAQAMGATAFRINHSDEIQATLHQALSCDGPVVISVPIDYSDNKAIVSLVKE